jgi:hypothetical protein
MLPDTPLLLLLFFTVQRRIVWFLSYPFFQSCASVSCDLFWEYETHTALIKTSLTAFNCKGGLLQPIIYVPLLWLCERTFIVHVCQEVPVIPWIWPLAAPFPDSIFLLSSYPLASTLTTMHVKSAHNCMSTFSCSSVLLLMKGSRP